MLAHPRGDPLRNFESISHTMSTTDLPQRQGRLMLHLVCLCHRDNCRFRLDSQGTLLPTVARFRLRRHHVPLLVLTRAVKIVVLETVMPGILLLCLAVSIMSMQKR